MFNTTQVATAIQVEILFKEKYLAKLNSNYNVVFAAT
jgi:hypothetical protein